MSTGANSPPPYPGQPGGQNPYQPPPQGTPPQGAPPQGPTLWPSPAPGYNAEASQDYHVARRYDKVNIGNCTYCGAPLNPFYYFCTSCATPYQEHNAVVSAVRPVELSSDARVAKLAPHAWTLFWSYVGAIGVAYSILGFMILGGRKDPSPISVTLVSTIVLFITTGVFTGLYWRSLLPQFKKIGFDRPAAWIGIGILAPLLMVNWGWSTFLESLIRDKPPVELDAIPYPAQVVLICILPGIVEEIAFRGLLQYWLEVALTPLRAIWWASVLFSVIHMQVLNIPYLFAVGFLLGWVRHKTNSLYPSMLIHFLHNWFVITWLAR